MYSIAASRTSNILFCDEEPKQTIMTSRYQVNLKWSIKNRKTKIGYNVREKKEEKHDVWRGLCHLAQWFHWTRKWVALTVTVGFSGLTRCRSLNLTLTDTTIFFKFSSKLGRRQWAENVSAEKGAKLKELKDWLESMKEVTRSIRPVRSLKRQWALYS